MRQLGGAAAGGGISAAPLQVRVEELEGHNVAALPLLPAFPYLSLSLPFNSLVWTMSDSATSPFRFRRK
jgi:uncharacterized protein (DUF302 family)